MMNESTVQEILEWMEIYYSNCSYLPPIIPICQKISNGGGAILLPITILQAAIIISLVMILLWKHLYRYRVN